MLVQIERDMKAGIQPHVVVDGHLWAFPGEILSAVGIESGEHVSPSVCYQLQVLNLEYLKEKISQQEIEKLETETLKGE